LERELEDLRKQIKSLDSPQREREKAPAPEGDREAAGKPAPREAVVLYRKLCQRCHGADGKGETEKDGIDDVPDFTRRSWQERRSDAQLLKSILDGTEGGMPPFRKRLGEAEAKALVTCVRQFAGTPEKPENKTTQPSPKRGPEQSPVPVAAALSPPTRPRTGRGS
jgi:mono/diheme cytochrome c family protein